MKKGSLMQTSEAVAGGFVGMLLGGGIVRLLPVGETVGARVIVGSLANLGLGALAGWGLSRVREPLGHGLGAGWAGLGAVGLLAYLAAPRATLDLRVDQVSAPSGVQGLRGLRGAPGLLAGVRYAIAGDGVRPGRGRVPYLNGEGRTQQPIRRASATF